jgi:hypothetical protein
VLRSGLARGNSLSVDRSGHEGEGEPTISSSGLGAACMAFELSGSNIQIVGQAPQRLTDSRRPPRQISQSSSFLAQKCYFVFYHNT